MQVELDGKFLSANGQPFRIRGATYGSFAPRSDGEPFPETPVVIAYKPVPGAMTGTVLGSHAVGPGRLVFCQYRLAAGAAAGDAAACAILGDVLRWAALPRPVMRREAMPMADGRRTLLAYSWTPDVAS